MKIFIIILMFITTIYGISVIEANGKGVKVNETVTGFRHLTGFAVIGIALITIAYDVACLYLLACVV